MKIDPDKGDVDDQDWFNDIDGERFSLYALVDVIGMRALLVVRESSNLVSLRR